jgi:hypothetical protein
MSDLFWLGQAVAVAQVTTIQVTAYAVGTTYKITVGGVVISTIAAGSVNATAAALASAWNTSTHPYCAAVTASASTDTVTLTADTAGVPFVVTSAVSGSTGTIGAASTTTASSGPNHWDTAANWSTGSVPANGDNVYLRNSDVSILWGLAQSGVAPAALYIEASYTGTLGLPYNQFTVKAGSTDTTAPEYRAAYLAIGAALVRVGENYAAQNASGSSLLKIDLGTTAATVAAIATGSSTDGLPPLRLKTSSSTAALKVYAGASVGLCFETPAESGTIGSIDVFASGSGSSPEVYVGNVTQTSHNQEAGTGVLRNAPVTLKVENGASVVLAGSGTITTLEKRGDVQLAGSYSVTTLKG